MDAEVKSKWVEALRSGEYIQGHRCLHDRVLNTYCCLGVLCAVNDIPGSHGDDFTHRNKYNGNRVNPVRYDGCDIYLTENLRDKFKIAAHEMFQVAEMNDQHSSFTTIADYIEENL